MTTFQFGVDVLVRQGWNYNHMVISTATYTIDYDIVDDTISNDIFIFIHHIRVEDAYRRKGIASSVLSELQKIYKTSIMLLCFETLKPFYERIGFHVHELCEDDYYTMRRDYGN